MRAKCPSARFRPPVEKTVESWEAFFAGCTLSLKREPERLLRSASLSLLNSDAWVDDAVSDAPFDATPRPAAGKFTGFHKNHVIHDQRNR